VEEVDVNHHVEKSIRSSCLIHRVVDQLDILVMAACLCRATSILILIYVEFGIGLHISVENVILSDVPLYVDPPSQNVYQSKKTFSFLTGLDQAKS
jgi:hypothetical protein